MTVFDRILELFNKAKVKYEIIDHEPVYTSADAAKIRDTGLSNGAKALIFEADKRPILIVLPGDKKADTSEFKGLFKIRDLRMITPSQVKELTGLEVGSIPPVGKALGDQGIPSFFDEDISSKDYVAFNAGMHTKSIRMSPKDLIKVECPQIGKFSKPAS